jgi:hypothetical protein
LTWGEALGFDLAARGTSSSESGASFLTLGFLGDGAFALFSRCPSGASSSELEGGVFRLAVPYNQSIDPIQHKHLFHSELVV